MDAGASAPVPAASGPTLDMDVNPSAPLGGAPTASKTPLRGINRGNVKDGILLVVPSTDPDRTDPSADAHSGSQEVTNQPGTASPAASPQAAPSDGAQTATTIVGTPLAAVRPVSLDHPKVIDTAKLEAGDTTVSLFGIEGLSGPPAQGLQGYLQATDEHLTCQAQPTAGFVCLLTDGTDVAQVALVNGAARTLPDAPDVYHDQEVAAQAARRGIWADLPPPPETLQHPSVVDTATMSANSKTYKLDGLIGFEQPYAGQMQGYIAAHGDSLTCSQQPASGRYICLLPDGTDIAEVALANGAARVAPDAPDSYRLQQAQALNARRGFWLNPTPSVLVAMANVAQPDQYAFVSGDDGVDGISYIGGAPTAVIGGEEVFLVYGDALGWGYYDHYHHWQGAPDRYQRHLEHFHPDGRGLRGYGHDGFHHDAEFRREEITRHGGYDGLRRDEAIRRDEGFRREASMQHPGGMAGRPAMMGERGAMAGHSEMGGRPGFGTPMGGHPGGMENGGFVHPGATASAGGFHPGGPAPGGFHPGGPTPGGMAQGGMAGGGFHPGGVAPGGMAQGGMAQGGMAGGGFHPGGMAPGGMAQGGMAGGFHPGGMAPGGTAAGFHPGGSAPGGLGGGFHPGGATPAMHAAAPAVHASAGGNSGKH
jgi:endonuclease YncB( thermonuclease family)